MTDPLVSPPKKIIVFEEIDLLSLPFILWYLARGFQVHCFSITLSVEKLSFTRKWLAQKKILRLEYSDIDLNLQFNVNNIVLEDIEEIFAENFGGSKTVAAINHLVGSDHGSDAFKKSLSMHLFEFQRMNLYFEQGYAKAEGVKDFLFLPGPTYQRVKRISSVKKAIASQSHVTTPACGLIYRGFSSLATRVKNCSLLFLFPFWILLKVNIPSLQPVTKKNFQVGLRICYNDWPPGNKYRRFDFLIDNTYLTRKNTLLCLEETVKPAVKQKILENQYRYVEVRDILKHADVHFIRTTLLGKFLPDYLSCLFHSVSEHLLIVELCPEILFKYLEWTRFVENYQICHYVAYCEHLPADAIRNIVLENHRVTTWNYAHSNGTNDFFTPPGHQDYINKFYAYFHYNNFVVWGQKMGLYYQKHPITVDQYPALGCLWSEHVRTILDLGLPNDTLNNARRKFFEETHQYPKKIIGVFDVNTGGDAPLFEPDIIAFIQGILQVLEDYPDIGVIFKKKEFFEALSLRVPDLIPWYQKIRDHPRCYITDQVDSDPAETIAASDLVISAPFTSTSMESLCARKKALYFDATGRCRGLYYDRIPQFVPHSYAELKQAIDHWIYEISDDEFASFLQEYIAGEFDPYLDGKAITRFRQQLSKRPCTMEKNS